MGVTITSGVLNGVLAAARATPRREVCGLLFGSPDRIEGFAPCANVAADPARMFEIDPAALLAAYRAARRGGPAVIGHYHSHPSGNAVPSVHDAASAMGDGALWAIVARDVVRLWRTVRPDAFVEVAFEEVAMTRLAPGDMQGQIDIRKQGECT